MSRSFQCAAQCSAVDAFDVGSVDAGALAHQRASRGGVLGLERGDEPEVGLRARRRHERVATEQTERRGNALGA